MRGWVEQMTAIMMHVVRYHQFGGPEVLKKLEQLPRPEPKSQDLKEGLFSKKATLYNFRL
jgi:hypothetical protein